MRGSLARFRAVAMAAMFAALSAASYPQEAKPAPALEIVTMSDVFSRAQDGYPEVRIPAVVATLKRGAVLAFAEGRQGGDHSENDIVLKRSLDGGITWQPLQVVAEMGGDSLNDPCAVVLPESGQVLLMYQRYPKGYHTQKMGNIEAAELGFGGPRNTQSFLIRSADDGTVVMDARQTSGNCRKGARSSDAGETWETMYSVADLQAPPCMGSVLSFATAGDKGVLMASMPNTPTERKNGALFLSRDGGKTWPEKRVLYAGGFAYSCLTQLPGNRIGCLFERDDYVHISFAVFDVGSFIAPGHSQQPTR